MWKYDDVLTGKIRLDHREGVRCESAAIVAPDPRVSSAVHHRATCDLCEWSYRLGAGPLEAPLEAEYAVSCTDVMEMIRWVGVHRSGKNHVRALDHFKKNYV